MDDSLLDAIHALAGGVEQAAIEFWAETLGVTPERAVPRDRLANAPAELMRSRGLTELRARAEHAAWPIQGSWSPAAEEAVASSIADVADSAVEVTRPDIPLDWIESWMVEWRRARQGRAHPLDRGYRWPALELPDGVAQLFLVSELMEVAVWDEGTLELWRTRRLRLPAGRRESPFTLALFLNADAENDGNLGWHIHPKDKDGRHFGYKLLFDAERTQEDLSWELHSVKGKETPWGDPAKKVLVSGTAKALHRACLAALVRDSRPRRDRAPVTQLHHKTFREWARMFQKPGRTSYVAHPPVPEPRPWLGAVPPRANR